MTNNDGNNSDYKTLTKCKAPGWGHHCIILLNGSCKVIAHIPTFQVTPTAWSWSQAEGPGLSAGPSAPEPPL